jgi:hypothetical protein
MLEPSDYVKQYDPTIDLTRPVKIRLEEGASQVSFTKFTSSSVSESSIQFNSINPPSAEIIVDRRVFVKANFRLTFLGTNVPAGQYLLQTNGINNVGQPVSAWQGGLSGGVDALRAFPLSQILTSLVVKINSQSFTQDINKYIEPLMRYSNFRDVAEENWSLTPTMQDTYQQYSDFTIYGSARNVLGNYGENQYRTPRGGFSQLNVTSQTIQGNNTDGVASTGLGDIMVATVDVSLTEPLFISPLAFGKRSHRGLFGITTMNVTLNISSSYQNYIWSHDLASSGKIINNISLDYDTTSPGMAENPAIMFTYYTPRFAQMLPKTNIYPYHNINDYVQQQSTTIPPGGFGNINVNNIQLDSVPKRIFIYLRKTESAKTYNDTDTYAKIISINFTFGNQPGILSDANEQQLFELSAVNGNTQSWNEWSRHTGAVLCIDFAKQVPMQGGNIVGKSGSYQVMYTIQIQNMSNQSIRYDVHTVVVSDGYIEVIDKSVDRKTNLGEIDKIYDSELIHPVDFEDFEMFYGAGFAETLRKYGKKGFDLAKEYAPAALKSAAKKFGPDLVNYGISHVPFLGPELGQSAEWALRALASGEMSQAEYNKYMKKLGSGVVGGSVVGGKPATKRAMKKKLHRM